MEKKTHFVNPNISSQFWAIASSDFLAFYGSFVPTRPIDTWTKFRGETTLATAIDALSCSIKRKLRAENTWLAYG